VGDEYSACVSCGEEGAGLWFSLSELLISMQLMYGVGSVNNTLRVQSLSISLCAWPFCLNLGFARLRSPGNRKQLFEYTRHIKYEYKMFYISFIWILNLGSLEKQFF
jgi:hypothetical protein